MSDKAIEVHVLQCGTVGTDETIPDRSRSGNPLAWTGVMRASHRVWLPVFAYLVVHPQGTILVDTGWHTDVRGDQRKHMSWKLNMASKADLPAGQAVSEQLSALGMKPEDIGCVLLTHMDVDHVSGIALVRGARRFIASAEELEAVRHGDVRYNPRLWEGIDVEPFSYEDTGIGPQDRSLDYFGDGSVQLVDASGHSAGTAAVLVSRGDRFVLLTADSCYNHASWEEERVPGLMHDRGKALQAIQWVHEMSLRPGCAEILASHDPAVKPHVTIL